MSGGHFDYIQQRIHDVANELENLTDELALKRRLGFEGFSPETIKKFYEGVKALWIAEAYIHRIDWLVSADDGEKDFHKFLKADLQNIDFLWDSLQKKISKRNEPREYDSLASAVRSVTPSGGASDDVLAKHPASICCSPPDS